MRHFLKSTEFETAEYFKNTLSKNIYDVQELHSEINPSQESSEKSQNKIAKNFSMGSIISTNDNSNKSSILPYTNMLHNGKSEIKKSTAIKKITKIDFLKGRKNSDYNSLDLNAHLSNTEKRFPIKQKISINSDMSLANSGKNHSKNTKLIQDTQNTHHTQHLETNYDLPLTTKHLMSRKNSLSKLASLKKKNKLRNGFLRFPVNLVCQIIYKLVPSSSKIKKKK
jgi:hypothetical protein